MQAHSFHGTMAFALLAASLVCYGVGGAETLGGAFVLGGVFEVGFWAALIRGARRAEDKSRTGRIDRYRAAVRRLCPRRSAAGS